MDIREVDGSVGCCDSDLMKLHAAAASGHADVGEGVSGGLRRDIELLGAGGKKSSLSSSLSPPLLPSSSSAAAVRQNMKHLLNEFKGLYEEKLRHLENKDESKGILKMKLRILQSYVNDLGDQNEVLVQTIEDLEREANEKVANLDTQLQRADQILYEQQLKLEASKEENDHLRRENLDIKIDLNTLVGAIQQAEIMQKFDFCSLNLRSIPLEQIARPAFHSSTTKKSEEILKPHLDSLKSQLLARDQMIQNLHWELKEALCDNERSKDELQKREDMIQRQQNEILFLQQKKDGLLTELEAKEHRIYHLQIEQQNRETETHCRTAQQEQNELDVDCKLLEQAQHKVQKKNVTVTELKDQIKQLEQQYNETVEDNGRLQARLEAWMITAQSEQDILSNEVFCKEDIIHKLRMKQLGQDEKCNIAEEQIQHQEKLLEQLHQKYLAAVNIVEKQQQMIHSLEQDLQTAMIAEREMATGVAQCEETIKNLQMELSSLHSVQELDNKTITHKNQIINELQQESDSLKQKLKEAQCKMNDSEGQVNTLGLEVNMLKMRLVEKTDLAQNLEDQILKQQEVLIRASETLRDTKKAAGNKINQKENKLCVLQEELVDAQKQYSACYEEFLHREKLMQKLKEETMKLTDQIKQHSQDISKLSNEKQKIELEMAVITEKHRTAQQEVSNRDQIILKLKTLLKTAQEKYTGSQEELGVQEAEINRLTEKLKDLQNEIRKQKNICNVQEDQLSQAGKSIQEFEHEREMLMEEIQTNKKYIAQLHSDLDATKQSYNADLERWSQKIFLLQKELDSTIVELQDTLSKMQEFKTIGIQLKEDLEKTKHLHHETINLVEQHEDTIQKQNCENLHLREQIDLLQDEVTKGLNQAKVSESTADLYRQKYQTNTDRIQDLEKLVQSLEEESKDSSNRIFEVNETVHNLKDEMVTLQHRYEEKCSQMETCEEMIDQLSEELNASQEDLKSNKDHIQQCEQLIQILKDEARKVQRETAEQEETILQLQSDLTHYQLKHGHSNEEYEAQTTHSEYLQKELETVKKVCNEKINRLGECEQTILDLRAEITKSADQRKNCVLEVERLEKTLQTLQLNVAASQHKHKLELVQLQQQITQLESDLTDSQKAYNQTEKAIWKRDDLLRKSKADLLQAQENIKEKVTEVEALDIIAKGLRVGMQGLQKHKRQIEKENTALRTEIQQLNQELQDIHQQYREKAQELANREEKFILMESNLQATEKQLNNQISEIVRQEQNQQKLHTELKTLKEHLEITEEEMNKYKQIGEELKNELNVKKQQQQQNFQEILKHQQGSQKLELANAKDEIQTLQQQLQQQEDLVSYLQDELNQERNQYQEQQRQLVKLNYHTSEMEAEVDNLKIKQKSEVQMLKDQENHISTMGEEMKHLQNKHLGVCEELMKEKSQVKNLQLKMTTAEKKTKSHAEEVQKYEERLTILSIQLNQTLKKNQENIKDLATKDEQLITHEKEMAALQEKLQDNVEELEALKRTLEAAQSDNNRFHEESELMVSNVNQWITEQGIANDTLGTKIKEQNQLVSHLTADKVRLQETIEALNQELKKVRAEIEDKKTETEQIWALQSHSASQQILLNQLRGRLEDQEYPPFPLLKTLLLLLQVSASINCKVVQHAVDDNELGRHEQESLIAEKLATIEDMHNRLKASIQSIQLLNQQLNTLSKENLKQKRQLEKEQAQRHQLELQSETFGQTILSLRTQLKDQTDLEHLSSQPVSLLEGAMASDPTTRLNCYLGLEQKSIRVSQKERVEDLTREDLEKSEITDPVVPDKSYWIQRVGELSAQLQESTEYWTDKMNELTKEIEHVNSPSSKK
ncbi:early endosome antigen 1-like [Heptranchias perlo]|uniref:early endosome antigen 1-like n=1 Tax=Heptranchias perlo TaxID=212740 RepID=UPI00355A8275